MTLALRDKGSVHLKWVITDRFPVQYYSVIEIEPWHVITNNMAF